MTDLELHFQVFAEPLPDGGFRWFVDPEPAITEIYDRARFAATGDGWRSVESPQEDDLVDEAFSVLQTCLKQASAGLEQPDRL